VLPGDATGGGRRSVIAEATMHGGGAGIILLILNFYLLHTYIIFGTQPYYFCYICILHHRKKLFAIVVLHFCYNSEKIMLPKILLPSLWEVSSEVIGELVFSFCFPDGAVLCYAEAKTDIFSLHKRKIEI
jgi:hypothetical protein